MCSQVSALLWCSCCCCAVAPRTSVLPFLSAATRPFRASSFASLADKPPRTGPLNRSCKSKTEP